MEAVTAPSVPFLPANYRQKNPKSRFFKKKKQKNCMTFIVFCADEKNQYRRYLEVILLTAVRWVLRARRCD